MPEFAVFFWIHAFTTVVDVQTLTTLLTEPGLIFLAGGDGITIRMISTVHIELLLLNLNEFQPDGQKNYLFCIDHRIPFDIRDEHEREWCWLI